MSTKNRDLFRVYWDKYWPVSTIYCIRLWDNGLPGPYRLDIRGCWVAQLLKGSAISTVSVQTTKDVDCVAERAGTCSASFVIQLGHLLPQVQIMIVAHDTFSFCSPDKEDKLVLEVCKALFSLRLRRYSLSFNRGACQSHVQLEDFEHASGISLAVLKNEDSILTNLAAIVIWNAKLGPCLHHCLCFPPY